MNVRKLSMKLFMSMLVFLFASEATQASSHDVAWTFGNVGSSSYRLDAFEPADAGLQASLGSQDPTLTVELGKRYQVTVINYGFHPFEVLAKASSPGSDIVLLSMSANGSFESDPLVNWVDDGLGTVTFTLTRDLFNAMNEPGNSPPPGCARS